MSAPILEIDWDWVKRELIRKERVPTRIPVDEYIEHAASLAETKSASTVKRIIGFKAGSVELEGPITFAGRRLSSYMRGAAEAHLFVVTIGGEIEKEASLLMSGDEPLYGYLLDSIGSLAVESLAEAFEDRLREASASDSRSVSMRLSPGYCDWPVEEQALMSKVVDFPKAGVSLTESCMMVPRKSISAMVGIGPKDLFSNKKSQCVTCDRQDCDHRRAY